MSLSELIARCPLANQITDCATTMNDACRLYLNGQISLSIETYRLASKKIECLICELEKIKEGGKKG